MQLNSCSSVKSSLEHGKATAGEVEDDGNEVMENMNEFISTAKRCVVRTSSELEFGNVRHLSG